MKIIALINPGKRSHILTGKNTLCGFSGDRHETRDVRIDDRGLCANFLKAYEKKYKQVK